jgi:hypothetical protein
LADSESFSIADNDDLSMGDIDFSVACWVNLESNGTNQFISAKDAGAGSGQREYGLIYLTGTNRFRMHVSADGTNIVSVTDDTVLSTATWYFIAAGHDTDDNTVWIVTNADATPVTPQAHATGVIATTTSGFALGGESDNGSSLDGILDECGVWKRDIRADLSWLYNSGVGRTYAAIEAEAGGGTAARMLLLGVGDLR